MLFFLLPWFVCWGIAFNVILAAALTKVQCRDKSTSNTCQCLMFKQDKKTLINCCLFLCLNWYFPVVLFWTHFRSFIKIWVNATYNPFSCNLHTKQKLYNHHQTPVSYNLYFWGVSHANCVPTTHDKQFTRGDP